MGERHVKRLEKAYGKPMSYILEVERPKQIEQRRQNGEHIDIVGENLLPLIKKENRVPRHKGQTDYSGR